MTWVLFVWVAQKGRGESGFMGLELGGIQAG